jgi:hypothetical protein
MNGENEVGHIVSTYSTRLEKKPGRPCKTNPLTLN